MSFKKNGLKDDVPLALFNHLGVFGLCDKFFETHAGHIAGQAPASEAHIAHKQLGFAHQLFKFGFLGAQNPLARKKDSHVFAFGGGRFGKAHDMAQIFIGIHKDAQISHNIIPYRCRLWDYHQHMTRSNAKISSTTPAQSESSESRTLLEALFSGVTMFMS
jgi:hypothetical protein